MQIVLIQFKILFTLHSTIYLLNKMFQLDSAFQLSPFNSAIVPLEIGANFEMFLLDASSCTKLIPNFSLYQTGGYKLWLQFNILLCINLSKDNHTNNVWNTFEQYFLMEVADMRANSSTVFHANGLMSRQ